jgi:hypothetical protein
MRSLVVAPWWTAAQAALLGDWIARSGKRLVAAHVTHDHGDY